MLAQRQLLAFAPPFERFFSSIPEMDNEELSELLKYAPKKFDWNKALNPARNQGPHSTCWAFATTAAVEAMHYIKKGRRVILSPQQLVDCCYDCCFGSCGGNVSSAFTYIQWIGLTTEKNYPYTGRERQCCSSKIKHPLTKIDGHQFVRNNEVDLLKALLVQGPIVVNMAIGDSLYWYSGGILYDPSLNDEKVKHNHSMLLIGYGKMPDTGENYWILQNSWGLEWGVNGTVLLAMGMGRYGQCKIASYPLFPRILVPPHGQHKIAEQPLVPRIFVPRTFDGEVGIMGRALVQPTMNVPASVAGQRHGQFPESEKAKGTLEMTCNSQTPVLRIRGFSGLRGSNASEDSMVKSGHDFHSKVASAISVWRRKAKRCAPMAMFELFTQEAIKVVMLGQEEARRLGQNFVGTEHVLLCLIGEGTGISAKVLKSLGINCKEVRVEVEKIIGRGSGLVDIEIPFTPRAKHVLDNSLTEARQLGHDYVGSEHLLLGLLRESEGVVARVLESLGADPCNIREQASFTALFICCVICMVEETTKTVGPTFEGPSGNKVPILAEYGTNLTKLAEEGKLDPVVGRQEQIERVAQILGRRTKNNPCLIGEPSVGKTAIVEGLAQRIANGDVPKTIEWKKVITLDMGLLVCGTKYRGEFLERLKDLREEIKQSDETILFIDKVHTLIGAGVVEEAIDVASILKPALARRELQCIGATIPDEYRELIEKDSASERRFEPVKVPEPSVDETIQILKGPQEEYEIPHKVRYMDDALIAAAQLSYRYVSDRFLPDKAIDLIDEAGSWVQLLVHIFQSFQLPEEARELKKQLSQITKEKNEAVHSQEFEKVGKLRDQQLELKTQISSLVSPLVTEVDIQHIGSAWTGIPVEEVSTDESDCLLNVKIWNANCITFH
ncbi:hypothetical protein L1049_019062 [Liquidambar formosana]|uniref:Uncharacterized protein n=1 Tax=Liquidambar formosana TaxID=63359 RepID=A0AAP0RB16_LIQFO